MPRWPLSGKPYQPRHRTRCCSSSPLSELRSIVARTVRNHALADEAKTPINGDVIFVTKAGDCDVDLWPDISLAIRSNAGLGKLDGPACINILLCRLCGLVRPNLVGCLASLDRILLVLGVALLGQPPESRQRFDRPSQDSRSCAADCRRHRTTP